jgi:hypothetical protein
MAIWQEKYPLMRKYWFFMSLEPWLSDRIASIVNVLIVIMNETRK